MAVITFPNAPTTGMTWPVPGIPGQPVYIWDGEKWTTSIGITASGNLASNTPPLMNITPAQAGTSLEYSRSDHRHPVDTSRAPLDSPVFTGNPQAPTPSAGNNSASLATTAFVSAAVVTGGGALPSNAAPAMDGTAAAGSSALFSRGDHVHPKDTTKVSKAGDTMTGPLNISPTSGPSQIDLGAPAGQFAQTAYYAGGVGQWLVGMRNDDKSFFVYDVQGSATVQQWFVNGAVTFYKSLALLGGDYSLYCNQAANYVSLWGGYTRLNGGGLLLSGGGRPGYSHEFYNNSDRVFYSDGNNFILTGVGGGNAYKPGGGSWADTSDARIKNVESDYTQGLDSVTALRPVLYTYKGNDTVGTPASSTLGSDPKEGVPTSAPYPNSNHYHAAVESKKFAGLIAQEVEAIFPGMVTQRTGFIDGQPVTDLRDLDTTPLIFAFINAFKEMKARIEALESAG